MGLIAFTGTIEPGTTEEGAVASQQSAKLVHVATLLVALIAVSVLAGWALNIKLLKSLLPNLTTMKANTALCFALAAAAMWLSRNRQTRERYKAIICVLAAIVIASPRLRNASMRLIGTRASTSSSFETRSIKERFLLPAGSLRLLASVSY